MKDKIQFNLLQEHINNGRPCDPDNCPIAIAFTPLAQAINPTWWVQVGPSKTYIIKNFTNNPQEDRTVHSFKNSPLIQNWIQIFDDYKQLPQEINPQPPSPSAIEVDFENKTIKLIGEA